MFYSSTKVTSALHLSQDTGGDKKKGGKIQNEKI